MATVEDGDPSGNGHALCDTVEGPIALALVAMVTHPELRSKQEEEELARSAEEWQRSHTLSSGRRGLACVREILAIRLEIVGPL